MIRFISAIRNLMMSILKIKSCFRRSTASIFVRKLRQNKKIHLARDIKQGLKDLF